jgi:hypothetical protein
MARLLMQLFFDDGGMMAKGYLVSRGAVKEMSFDIL